MTDSEGTKQNLKLEQLFVEVIDGCRFVCAIHIIGLGKVVSWGNSWIIKRPPKLPSKTEAPSYANGTYCIQPADGDTRDCEIWDI